MTVKTVETLDELNEMIETSDKIVVDAFATWCGPCKMVKPILQDLAEDDQYSADVVFVDCEAVEGFTEKYKVKAVPTVIAFNKGQEVKRRSGMSSKGDFELMFQELENA